MSKKEVVLNLGRIPLQEAYDTCEIPQIRNASRYG